MAGAAVSAARTPLLATQAASTTALTAVPAAVEAAAVFTGVLLCSPPEAGAEVSLLALILDVAAGQAAGDRKLLLVA